MPYSARAKYEHHKQRPLSHFIKSTLKTVPLNHTYYKGKKFKKNGALAIVGQLRPKYHTTRWWVIESILIPK